MPRTCNAPTMVVAVAATVAACFAAGAALGGWLFDQLHGPR